jgi:GH15 family glucan-1,4-alpha-glucosidase
MPLVFFLAPSYPHIIGTLKAIDRSPRAGGLVSDGLVFRYDTQSTIDGVGDPSVGRNEGTFNLCTFWLVEALTRAGGMHPAMLDEARLLISAAYNLDRALK